MHQKAIIPAAFASLFSLLVVLLFYSTLSMKYAVMSIAVPVALMLGATIPETILLIIVSLIPLDAFAEITQFSKKITLFKLLFPLALVGVIRYAIERKLPPLTKIDKLVLVLAAYISLMTFFSVDRQLSISFLRRFLSMIALYLSISWLFRKNPRPLISFIIFSSVISAFFGLYSWIIGENPFSRFTEEGIVRATGASNISPNHYAGYMIIPFIFALDRSFREKFDVKYFLAALMIAAGIIFSYSRSGFLTLVLSILFIIATWKHNLKFKHFFIAFVIAASLVPAIPSSYWDRISSISAYITGKERPDTSVWRRENYFEVAKRIIKEKPFIGVGPGNFRLAHAKAEYQPEVALVGLPRRPHNLYVQILGEFGLLGFLVFGYTLFNIIKAAYDLPRENLYRAVTVSIFSFILIDCFFIQPLLDKPFWIILAILSIFYESSKTSLSNSYNIKA